MWPIGRPTHWVGRRQELMALRAGTEALRQGEGAVVWVEGEALRQGISPLGDETLADRDARQLRPQPQPLKEQHDRRGYRPVRQHVVPAAGDADELCRCTCSGCGQRAYRVVGAVQAEDRRGTVPRSARSTQPSGTGS